MAKLMKLHLHGNHDNHSTTKCFFAISSENVVKNHPISNASWVHNFQLSKHKTLWGNRSVLVKFENIIFMGWACQLLERDKWKNRDKTGKMLNFPGLWRGIFTVCPWTLHFTILTPNALFDSRIEPENSKKNYVFQHIFKHSLNFEPLPPLIYGLNSKFDYATLCVLIWSLLAKISFQNLISIKSYWGKTVGGSARPP